MDIDRNPVGILPAEDHVIQEALTALRDQIKGCTTDRDAERLQRRLEAIALRADALSEMARAVADLLSPGPLDAEWAQSLRERIAEKGTV